MELVLPLPLQLPPWMHGALTRLRALRVAMSADVQTEVAPGVVERARSGDHAAFKQIVDHYDHRLRALAYRLVNDRDRMDDVLQDAYVKAFRSLPKFKGEAALGTWLYRIVYNSCVDDLRKRRKTVSIDDRLELVDSRPGPGETTALRRDLAAALGTLPADQRAAVMLVDADGLDYAEAAEVLGVAAGTIASRLNRARTALRLILDPSR